MDLKKLLQEISAFDVANKKLKIKDWLAQDTSYQRFPNLLEIARYLSDIEPQALAPLPALGQPSPNEQINNLVEILSEVLSKKMIAISYIRSLETPYKQNALTQLTEAVPAVLNRYNDIADILNVITTIYFDSDSGYNLNFVIDFCIKTYQSSDWLKFEMVRGLFKANILTALNLPKIETLLATITDEDCAIELIEFVADKAKLSPVEIIAMQQQRVHREFRTVKTVLANKKVEDCIKKESLPRLVTLLKDDSDDFCQVDQKYVERMPLLDVFSYCHLRQERLQLFVDSLTKEVKEQISEAASNLAGLTYVKSSEYQKLKILASDLKLSEIQIFTNYLREKIKIQIIADEEIADYQINFDEGFVEDEKTSLNQKFRILLTPSHSEVGRVVRVGNDQIIGFFSDLLKIDLANLDQYHQEQFCEFFNEANHKQQFAYMFLQNDGIEFLRERCLPALTDGCAANIANVFKTAIYEYASRNNFSARILYQFYVEDIFAPFVNSATDAIQKDSDPLNNQEINQSSFVPITFKARITDRLIHDRQETMNFVLKILTKSKEESHDFVADPEKAQILEESSPLIALYYILSEIPALLNLFPGTKEEAEEKINNITLMLRMPALTIAADSAEQLLKQENKEQTVAGAAASSS